VEFNKPLCKSVHGSGGGPFPTSYRINSPGALAQFLHKDKIQAPGAKKIQRYDQLFDLYDLSNTRVVYIGWFGKTRDIMESLPDQVIDGFL